MNIYNNLERLVTWLRGEGLPAPASLAKPPEPLQINLFGETQSFKGQSRAFMITGLYLGSRGVKKSCDGPERSR